MMSEMSPYAPPREIENVDDCLIYHTIELPSFGVLEGQWDLRPRVDEYLGRVPLVGMRVLELGTANGFLCSEMERRGADVVAYDLSENVGWDLVPYGGGRSDDYVSGHRKHIRMLNNAWWLTHRELKLNARVVYGSVYEVPKEIGKVDVALFGSILLHLRDPFLALQKAVELEPGTVIVTDRVPEDIILYRNVVERFLDRLRGRSNAVIRPHLRFLPDPNTKEPEDTWWQISPELISRFLQVLGYPQTEVTYHNQYCELTKCELPLYTVVGRRG